MEKCYKFRIYPNKNQEEKIQKTFSYCRFVYNYFLDLRITAYKERHETINYFQCSLELTKLKKELIWLKEVDSLPLQEELRNLDFAYKKFFRRLKKGIKSGYPKFKKKKERRKSYRTKQHTTDGYPSIYVKDSCIRLPKLGKIKCKVSKKIEGRILNATVSQNPSGKYFVSLCCTDVEMKQLHKTGEVVGIDLGLKSFAITSDGVEYTNHKYLRQSEKKLAKLQRQLSRKSSGSKNREKARIKVAMAYEKVANQRKDYLQKLSTDLIKQYDIICIEDLNVEGMKHNHKLAKSVSDVGFYSFKTMLKYKADWYGKKIVEIDRFFPSSQLCSNCSYQWKGTKDLSVREWTCPECGTYHDRDVNAAKNILNEGLRLLA